MNAKSSKVFKPVMLSLAVSGLMYGASLPQAFANDMDIYRPAVEGKTTLVMMFDTSGSMGWGSGYRNTSWSLQADYGICVGGTSNVKSISSGTTPSYLRYFCEAPSTTTSAVIREQCTQVGSVYRCFDRMTRLKDAIFELMDGDAIKDTVVMGLAQYSTQSNSSNTAFSADGRSGKIVVPARPLSPSQRSAIKQATAGFVAWNGTPTANAYAEAGAYLMGTTTRNATTVPNGSGFNHSVTSSKSGSSYISPLPIDTETLECNGQGIYFFTDGEPNSSNNPSVLMSLALRGAFSRAGGLPSGSQGGHATPETGAFAKYLFDKSRNPAGVQIKTAVVGFGATFAGAAKRELEDPETGKLRTYYDCRTVPNVDARNACNWGEKTHPDLPGVGGFGQGGFYFAASSADIIQSVVSFIDDLKVDIPAVPTGAVVVPHDTLAPDSLQSFAYLPLMEPKPNTSTVVWPGSIKKYDVKNGTIYGKNGSLVFSRTGSFADNTYDRWSVTNVPDRGEVQVGGIFDRLPMPTTTNSLDRNVWIERSASSKILDRVIPTTTAMNALTGLTNWQRRYLLNFMGYNLPENTSLTESANALPENLQRPTEPFRVMGGVVHSTPQLLTYSANLNEDGSLSETRDESLLFGSLEGALHLVSTNTGVEQMAFIPRPIIDNQARALRPDTIGRLSPDKTAMPSPTAFGVDAPWTAYAEYERQGNQLKATMIYAYGGLRMGGDAFYGLDLTSRNSPKMLFNITPATSGFARLGQTWGKPVVTRIRYNNQTRLVLIVSGGYDVDYEKADKDRSVNTAVRGNAVYIVDAKTGERLLTIGRTGQGANLSHDEIKFSIVGRVKTLDRDSDGLTDHLYFADLGGQVFRVDLQNAPNTSVANFGTRVVRLANLTTANGAGQPGPRFYESPVVTIHDEGKQRFAVVNVGSGDRSNPLYDENNTPNRVYGLIDRDVARIDLYSPSVSMNSQNIELTSLIQKPTTAAHKAAMLSDDTDRKNGWFYPLEGYGSIKAGLKGLKAFNEGAAIRNDYYIAVYNPNVTNNGANKCSAQVLGATELHRYCLPFGICDVANPQNNLQRFQLGQGIHSVNFGPSESAQSRRLIYQQPTNTVVNQETGTAQGQHLQYNTPPRLVPIRWYEKQPKLKP